MMRIPEEAKARKLRQFFASGLLSYDYKPTGSPRPIPIFGEIERTFVENRKALQKAGLIRLSSDGDSICVVDRQNPHKPAAYFENFLRARRPRSEAELTAKIVDLTMTVVRKHKSSLPAETVKSLGQRVYSASQSGGTVDGEKSD